MVCSIRYELFILLKIDQIEHKLICKWHGKGHIDIRFYEQSTIRFLKDFPCKSKDCKCKKILKIVLKKMIMVRKVFKLKLARLHSPPCSEKETPFENEPIRD